MAQRCASTGSRSARCSCRSASARAWLSRGSSPAPRWTAWARSSWTRAGSRAAAQPPHDRELRPLDQRVPLLGAGRGRGGRGTGEGAEDEQAPHRRAEPRGDHRVPGPSPLPSALRVE